jgi:Cu+-exporting ATPase
MSVDTANAKHRSEYDGKTFYFCCDGCKTKFDAEPACSAQTKPVAFPTQAKRLHVLHAHETKELAKDPVCSMTIDPVTTQQHSLAMESAPLTLVKGQLSVIFHTRAVSSDCTQYPPEPVLRVCLQRSGVSLAADVLYPVFGLVMSPMIAALAMSLSSVSS